MTGLVDGNNFFVSCERVFDRSLEGRPVAVLSSNDGCVISRSNELKALGIPMGAPYFQVRPRARSLGIEFRSGNFELYADMSRRLMETLGEMFGDIEQYSIDEAFVFPPGGMDFLGFGRRARAGLLRRIGIPCGIGFARTKTLAKIANHIAKKTDGGVFVMPEDARGILEKIPVSEVWGVGRRLAPKLGRDRILTARDLAESPGARLRKKYGVPLERTALELSGVACPPDSRGPGDLSDSIACSGCFGEPVEDFESLAQSAAHYLGRAAEKLRAQGQRAGGAGAYLVYYPERFPRALEGGAVSAGVAFSRPTDDTSEMMKAVLPRLREVFIAGRRYKKSGVTLWGLESGAAQGELFGPSPVRSRLYSSVDEVNRKFGRGTLFPLAEGIDRKWSAKRAMLSKAYTTSWDGIISVK